MKGTARPPTPRPQRRRIGKRSAGPQGRRRQGSKPDSRDSARGAGRSPRARRRSARTPPCVEIRSPVECNVVKLMS
ncbi:hypothetical protein E7Z57_02850 [Ralstonia pseudosolanacearum]|uniref:Uncharacterized protein n=1 Tax=Ralstonia solanacearum TaxID=305 RepID=A0AA92EA59_RALSL|nr:hypothetical protein E7Z57_02850 [Ralstonia pseudosolanacearum]